MTQSIALVGIGKIARDQHIPTIAHVDGMELAATASRNPASTVDGIEGFTSLNDLLKARPDVTAVSLATPPTARFADAKAALLAGKHVMLEKPPGATISEVYALQGLAERTGATLFATWHSREAAGVDAARDWLVGKTLRSLRITWIEDVREWHPGQDWVWEPGGMGVFDPGMNALSVMTKILPEPVHLASAQLAFPANRDTPITADLVFDGPADVTARFDWGVTGEPEWSISIETDQGSARLSKGGARFEPEKGETVEGADEEYARLYRRFAALIEARESEVDLSPIRHVADAFMLGKRVMVEPFEW